MKHEPWFYGCLSYLFPGLGQIWVGKILRGIFFLVLFIGMIASLFFFINAQNFVGLFHAIGLSVVICFFPLITALDAVKQARLILAVTGTIPVGRKHDRWWPIFISILLPTLSAGLGYLYFKRWSYFIAWLLLMVLIIVCHFNALVSNILYSALFAVAIAYLLVLIKLKGEKDVAIKVFFLFFIILVLTDKLIESFIKPDFIKIVGVSMEPTINKGDIILVDHINYQKNSPQIGDIIGIWSDKLPKYEEYLLENDREICKSFYKRIVAKMGDIVTVTDTRQVYINGKKLANAPTYQPEYLSQEDMKSSYITCEIPEGYYYVVGDNIDSLDSRFFGPIPKEAVRGKVIKIFWPPNRAKLLP